MDSRVLVDSMNNLWLLPDDEKWQILEAIFSVPVNEREALLVKLLKDPSKAYLGTTDKSGPELAIEMIKKGVRAKSYGNEKRPKEKDNDAKRNHKV